MPQFLVCVPTTGTPSLEPCADAGGVSYTPVMMELPAYGAPSFDNANQLFAYGFTLVLIFWALGVTVGAILSLIRKGE